jgi:hypothetical protein
MFGRETMPGGGQVASRWAACGLLAAQPASQRRRDTVDRSPLGGDAANTGMIFSRTPSLKSVSAPSPLSPIPEFLIARFGRDDLNLDRQQHDSTELEAPTTGLINDPRMIGGDVAHGVDLIVVLPIGEGCDFAILWRRKSRRFAPTSWWSGGDSN